MIESIFKNQAKHETKTWQNKQISDFEIKQQQQQQKIEFLYFKIYFYDLYIFFFKVLIFFIYEQKEVQPNLFFFYALFCFVATKH